MCWKVANCSANSELLFHDYQGSRGGVSTQEETSGQKSRATVTCQEISLTVRFSLLPVPRERHNCPAFPTLHIHTYSFGESSSRQPQLHDVGTYGTCWAKQFPSQEQADILTSYLGVLFFPLLTQLSAGRLSIFLARVWGTVREWDTYWMYVGRYYRYTGIFVQILASFYSPFYK